MTWKLGFWASGLPDRYMAIYLPNDTTSFTPGTSGKNIYLDNAQTSGEGSVESDEHSMFNTSTGIFTLPAGRWQVFGQSFFDNVNDQNAVISSIVNSDSGNDIRVGSAVRGETAGQRISVLACTFDLTSTTNCYIRCKIVGGNSPASDSTTVRGDANMNETAFQLYRIAI